MHYALYSSFLLHLNGNNEALAANRYQFVLHRAALGEPAQITAERFLDRASLLFNLAANAGEFRRGFIVERAIGENFVSESSQEVAEVHDLRRKFCHSLPLELHGGRWIQRDFSPLRGAIDYQYHIPDIRRFKGCTSDSRFFHGLGHIQQANEVESAGHAAELADFPGKLLLIFDPLVIGRRCEVCDELLSQG